MHHLQHTAAPASVAAILARGRGRCAGARADGRPEPSDPADPLAEAKAILDEADAARRDLTPTEAARMNLLLAQAERAMPEPAAEPQGAGRRTVPDGVLVPLAAPQARRNGATVGLVGCRSADALFASLAPPQPQQFRDNASFLRTLVRNPGDDRLIADSAMETGDGATGGFVVPSALANSVYTRALEISAFTQHARLFPMPRGSGGSLAIPARADTTPANGVDGAKAQWVAEGAAATPAASRFRSLLLKLKKVVAFVSWSYELDEDSGVALESYLREQLGERIAEALDDAILRGTGAGQPQGLLNAPATIAVAAVGSQTADTLSAQNFLAMAARLSPGSWNSARWFVHPSSVPFLARATPAATAAGGADVAYAAALPVVAFSDATGEWRILGRPVTLTDRCSALGDLGDVVLADLSAYALGLSPVLSLDKSNAPGWLTSTFDLRAISRADGQPLWEAPMTPRRGSDTVSPFITLAAR